MVDADTVILLKGAALIVPECVLMGPAVAGLEGIGEAKMLQLSPGGAGFGQGEGVGVPDGVVPAIFRRGNGVVISAQDKGLLGSQQVAGVVFQRGDPFELVVILLPGAGLPLGR